MADPKRGLSSWLHVAQRATAAPSTASQEQQEQQESATSPLDISLAILRAKETISRISPDKRVVVEEIDEDPDDAEFDEKAHWGRRAAASRRKKLKSSRSKATDPGYSIKAFCVAQPGATASSVPPAIAQELADLVPESAEEHSEELSTDATGQQPQDQTHGNDDDEQISSLDDPESIESISSSSAGSDDATEPPPLSETLTTPEHVTPQSRKPAPRVASVVKETPPSGRPKRQAVLRAQEASEAAKRETPPLAPGSLRRLKSDGLIDLRTPPPPKASKKVKRATSSSSSSQSSSRLELKTPPVGRKRKLEMDKSTPSPVAKETFFLSEQDRKQLQEIEAIAKLREQVRQTREKDLAFFSGKTAVNPFFTQAPPKPQLKSSSSTESTTDVIEIDATTPGSQERTRGPRWSKDAVHFPTTQHVVCAVVDASEDLSTGDGEGERQRMPPRRAAVGSALAEIVLLDDDDDSDDAMASTSNSSLLRALSQARDQQVETEATLSDLFWFRQYAAPDAALHSHDLLSSPFAMRCPFEYETETALIDALVEAYGVREKRVREVLDSLVAAKDKRREKAANLTLVDQYVPVTASGIVGNKEPLRLLASWLGAWKLGGGERERKSCFQAELFVFEGDESDSDDDLADLCRLFVLEGDSGAGKSAAVYACAEELGYNVIEINAGQSRAGRNIVEIAGEATQSTRVLHMGDKKSKKSKSKKRSRKSLDSSASHLSLVLFEDVRVCVSGCLCRLWRSHLDVLLYPMIVAFVSDIMLSRVLVGRLGL